MALEWKLKEAVLSDLAELDLTSLNLYANRNKDILSLLYQRGVINDFTIEQALERAVIERARSDWILSAKVGEYADHVLMPECLAYALRKRIFSKREVRRIKFDHGDNPDTFSQYYCKGELLKDLRILLLNPEPMPKLDNGEYADPHPVCC